MAATVRACLSRPGCGRESGLAVVAEPGSLEDARSSVEATYSDPCAPIDETISSAISAIDICSVDSATLSANEGL